MVEFSGLDRGVDYFIRIIYDIDVFSQLSVPIDASLITMALGSTAYGRFTLANMPLFSSF